MFIFNVILTISLTFNSLYMPTYPIDVEFIACLRLLIYSFYQAMCRDSRIVPGAGATEIELARRLKEFSQKETG